MNFSQSFSYKSPTSFMISVFIKIFYVAQLLLNLHSQPELSFFSHKNSSTSFFSYSFFFLIPPLSLSLYISLAFTVSSDFPSLIFLWFNYHKKKRKKIIQKNFQYAKYIYIYILCWLVKIVECDIKVYEKCR